MTPQLPPEKIPRIIAQDNEEDGPATDTLNITDDGRVTGYAGSRPYQTTDGIRQAIATVSVYNHDDHQTLYATRPWLENADGDIVGEIRGREFENPLTAVEDARQVVQDMAADGYNP